VYWLQQEWAASYARQEIYGWAGAGFASGGGAETHGGRWVMAGVGFLLLFNRLAAGKDRKCNGNQSAMVSEGGLGGMRGL
jgi:hypothetical protein